MVVFPISGFLVNPLQKNCYNSRTGNDIDMKLEPVAKLGKWNTATWKNFDDDVFDDDVSLINDDVIVPF